MIYPFSTYTRQFESSDLVTIYYFSFKLAKNIGMYYQHKGFVDAYDEYHYLKAAYINGVKYGDTTLVGVNDKVEYQIPTQFSLSQNYPNPFNSSTTIKYSISQQSIVILKVFDVLGSEVVILVNKEQNQGNYELDFDGSKLTSGIYFHKLQAGDFVETKKMILLK